MNLFALKHSFKWHTLIAYVGGIATILFAISGILHPVMSWTGPQAVAFQPPLAAFSTKELATAQAILANPDLLPETVTSVKLVPGPNTNLLQITQNPHSPRRYFNLDTGVENRPLNDKTNDSTYDKTYAIWLARHYTGKTSAVTSIHLQTEFDHAYPWVNRLLPVYKVTFADDANTTAFIYTELGALASLTNTYKTRLQTLFRWVHTWSWLGDKSWLRFGVMLVLIISVLAMVATGAVLVFRMRKRSRSLAQSAHRYAGMVLWVVLGFFSVSGTYHLIYSEFTSHQKALISSGAFAPHVKNSVLQIDPEQELSSISLIQGPASTDTPNNPDELYFRVSTPAKNTSTDRTARFRGQAFEGEPLYFNASNGEPSALLDIDVAKFYATQHNPESLKITDFKQTNRFRDGYDFRNKRLPVWRITLDSGKVMFIDTATGLLVDQMSPAGIAERWSFSTLHKYNFMTPFVGRFYRDVFMVIALLFAVGLSIVGYWLVWKRRVHQKKNRQPREQ